MKEKKENNLRNAELIIISKGRVASQPYNVWIVKGSCSNSVFLRSLSGSETFLLEDLGFFSFLHFIKSSLDFSGMMLDLNLVFRDSCLMEVTEDMFTDVCERWNFASLLIWNHYLTIKSTKQACGYILHLWKMERKQTWTEQETKLSNKSFTLEKHL